MLTTRDEALAVLAKLYEGDPFVPQVPALVGLVAYLLMKVDTLQRRVVFLEDQCVLED